MTTQIRQRHAEHMSRANIALIRVFALTVKPDGQTQIRTRGPLAQYVVLAPTQQKGGLRARRAMLVTPITTPIRRLRVTSVRLVFIQNRPQWAWLGLAAWRACQVPQITTMLRRPRVSRAVLGTTRLLHSMAYASFVPSARRILTRTHRPHASDAQPLQAGRS